VLPKRLPRKVAEEGGSRRLPRMLSRRRGCRGMQPRLTSEKARAPTVAGATMQQHTRPEPQPLAEYANALEPHAAESRRESHCCIEIPGQGVSTSQCRPPSEHRWQLLCNSVSRRQCVNQKDASNFQKLLGGGAAAIQISSGCVRQHQSYHCRIWAVFG